MNPQLIAGALIPLLSGAGLVSAIGFSGVAYLALGLGYVATAALLLGASAVISSLAPKPDVPKPEDGKFNLKQNVPPLTYVLGKVQKGGDYAFLEEKEGAAYHVIVDAAHSVQGYVTHFLHDEPVTLDGSGNVVAPEHFGTDTVTIATRTGADASTAYGDVIAAFPAIWTADHRGDGLASVMMICRSVAADDFQKVYPQGMPVRTSIIEGHDQLYDPRTDTFGYSTNIALFRLWHLTHPVGGKMSLDDMYLPDWERAADVCDELVTNHAGDTVPRYHGGFWFRANSNPVQVGLIMDQAADMVLYERPDGKVGVHAGAYVTPDLRLTADDIVACSYDANERKATRVLAVRGRFTDPANGFNTTDAAIYGDPYEDDTERTKTVENQVVQDHNHMARLQKLAYQRANAPRVRLVVHFDAAREVAYRRFVTVHYPPKLTEAVVEITGRPTLSLVNLTYEFEGIVVPPALYAFDAAVEEGTPGASVTPVARGDVPDPEDFDVTIETETVSGGDASYGLATFTFQNALFQYEVEWQPTAGGVAQSVTGAAGEVSVRTAYLADGVEYRFRARTWSVGVPSDWTSYIILTA